MDLAIELFDEQVRMLSSFEYELEYHILEAVFVFHYKEAPRMIILDKLEVNTIQLIKRMNRYQPGDLTAASDLLIESRKAELAIKLIGKFSIVFERANVCLALLNNLSDLSQLYSVMKEICDYNTPLIHDSLKKRMDWLYKYVPLILAAHQFK